MYTTDQVAKMTGKTRQAIYSWVRRNPGVGTRFANVWVFTEEDIKLIGAQKAGRPRKPGTRVRRYNKHTPSKEE